MKEANLAGNPVWSQYFTPAWASERIVEQKFPGLGANDFVVDPCAGRGAFMQAVPVGVPLIGVEIDPLLAQEARDNSGRDVITGDFTQVSLPFEPNLILGNPPFSVGTICAFLERSHRLMGDNGRCGFILPAHLFQTASTVMRLRSMWSMEQEMIPNNLFHRLSLPLCFCLFTKERIRRFTGFFLYEEMDAIAGFKKQPRLLLTHGARRRGAWRVVVDAALDALGGRGSLAEIYAWIDRAGRPTPNAFWKDKIRQILQEKQYVRLGDALYGKRDIPGFCLSAS
jgi:adenine-specific DNA-methyltransferase